jgi:hypothetical protein
VVKEQGLGKLKKAKKENNEELIKFTADDLEVYDKHGMNGHIVWKK